ncbi:MAG TPA: hypothetical protein VFN15_02070 [Solirubrobacterales bacterium]|nr:hypothetical protein [Solirubrobacterales bacterium]
MRERLFKSRRGGVLLVAGAILGAVVAGPGAVVAQKAMTNLTVTSADKRYIKRGETVAAGKTVETKIDKFTSSTFSPIASTKLNAPGVGWLVVNATLSAKDDTTTPGDGKLQYRLAVNETPLTTQATSYELLFPHGLEERQNGALTGVIKTTAKGAYTVQLQAQEAAPGTGSTILGRNVSVQFVPKGKLPKTTKTKKPAA